MRGRLELIVPPYIQSSYLLASDTPTEQLAMWRQARQRAGGNVKTASDFSDRTHSVPLLIIL